MENPIWVDGQKSIQEQSTWQEQFDEEFDCVMWWGCHNDDDTQKHGYETDCGDELKSFIVNLLASEREELLREIVEEIENYPRKTYKTINEQCIQDGLLLEVREIIKKKI